MSLFFIPITPILEFSTGREEGRCCRYQQFSYGTGKRFSVLFDEDIDPRVFERIEKCFLEESRYVDVGESKFKPLIFAERKGSLIIVLEGEKLPFIFIRHDPASFLAEGIHDRDNWGPIDVFSDSGEWLAGSSSYSDMSNMAYPPLSDEAAKELITWKM